MSVAQTQIQVIQALTKNCSHCLTDVVETSYFDGCFSSYNDVVKAKRQDDEYPLYGYWVKGFFFYPYNFYTDAMLMIKFTPGCQGCEEKIRQRSGCKVWKKIWLSICVFDQMYHPEVEMNKKAEPCDRKLGTSDPVYLEKCKADVALRVKNQSRESHSHGTKQCSYRYCGKQNHGHSPSNGCHYCQKMLYPYEWMHFSGQGIAASFCDDRPAQLYECQITYSAGMENQITVSGFGLYDDSCSDCLTRMQEVDGKKVHIQ
jgi:hypothetical protein